MSDNDAGAPICGTPEAIEQFRKGGILILIDDEDRENEGDFVCAAEDVTPEMVNFMVGEGRGLLCATLSRPRQDALRLRRMVQDNTELHHTNFTISVDYRPGTTTGISAADRAATLRALADPQVRPDDFARPGHIFPIGAAPGGVLERPGHTEAVVDLCRFAGKQPAGALIEILNPDGTMARLPELRKIAAKHNLPLATINDLINYRLQNEQVIEAVGRTRIPNSYGDWQLVLYENKMNGETHSALVMGEPEKQKAPLVRVHSQCFTGETLGSLRCDCQAQLHAAMQAIAREGHGILLYMQQEGRGIGLKHKILAYALQDEGKDTVEANEALGFRADLRDYRLAAQILKDQGLREIRLMTNNPRKVAGVEQAQLTVHRVPIEVGKVPQNEFYLETKVRKLGHMLQQAPVEEIVKKSMPD